MRGDVLQLADYMQRDGRDLISGGLVAIGIGHVREGHRNALEGHVLNHTHGPILVPSPLSSNPIRGLELEAVAASRIGRAIAVVDGSGRGWGSEGQAVVQVGKGQEQHKLVGRRQGELRH